MNDGLLSQDEIDALLGGDNSSSKETEQSENNSISNITESDKDLLGEIGNISMGSASTALSTILNKKVNITTPKVSPITIKQIKDNLNVPMVALEVLYTEGLTGANLLVMKIADAAVVSSLMMGGDGVVDPDIDQLGELELSAVSEAMNQMVGSSATSLSTMLNFPVNISATSLSTMLNFPVNISPPVSRVWRAKEDRLADHLDEEEEIIKIAFSLTIEDHVDSEIMLILKQETAKAIVDRMTGGSEEKEEDIPKPEEIKKDEPKASKPQDTDNSISYQSQVPMSPSINTGEKVQKAEFSQLTPIDSGETKNINLILDVPLEISVVLGRTKKTIQEILDLGTGALIELDKLTEEPVEILVNGKKVALGEVVVIDENFGVRITDIINSVDRVKSLQE